MLDKEQIQNLAKRKKIDRDTIVREYLQILFLKNFYEHKKSQNTYFKGGTALHLLFSTPRFSMDLDFTSQSTKKELQELFSEILRKIKKDTEPIEMKERPISIGQSFSKTLSFNPDNRKYPLNISLDFSLREIPIQKVKKTVLRTDLPIVGLPVILYLSWEEVLAEKIRAILTRGRGRDLYDIYYLLAKGVEINWQLVRTKMKLYPKLEKKANKDGLINAVGNFTNNSLKQDLGQFLPVNEREDLIPILKEELLERLK